MPICGACGSAGCNCALEAGCGILVGGNGAPGTPYTVDVALDTEPDNILQCPGPQGDGLYAAPTPAPPLGCGLFFNGPNLEVQLDPAPGNNLICTPGVGLFVPPAAAPALSAEAFGCFGTGEPNTLGLNADGIGGPAAHLLNVGNAAISSPVFGFSAVGPLTPLPTPQNIPGTHPFFDGPIDSVVVTNTSDCRDLRVASWLTLGLAADMLDGGSGPQVHQTGFGAYFDNNTGAFGQVINQYFTDSNSAVPAWTPPPYDTREFRSTRSASSWAFDTLAPGASGTYRIHSRVFEHIRSSNFALTFSMQALARIFAWTI